MGRRIELSGREFGRLTVASFAGRDKHNRALWKCVCSCGDETIVSSPNLLNGYTKSCGCLFKELNTGLTREKHRLYHVWAGMKSRCLNQNHKNYGRYGGRGITVCKEWLKFKPFHEWAMINGYQDNLTLERIDNDGNYEPSNCKWATRQEQAVNRCFEQSGSGVRGVTWHKSSGKWYARVFLNRKLVYHGLFFKFEDACEAVEVARNRIYGIKNKEAV